MTHTVEARLRLSAQLGKMAAFDAMAKKLDTLDRKTRLFNRAQKAHSKALEMTAAAARLIPPAAALYGGKEAIMRFAEVEKRMVRTGLVLGATKVEMAGLSAEIQKAARSYALSTDDVMGTVDAYAAAGAEIGDIRADIDGLVKAQQALGADGKDIVQSWDAGRKVFGLASKDAEEFFSIIGAGSAAGKVEAADFARMLPETLPIAARYGLQGAEGVERLVAALETMADFKGSPSEAATSLNDFLEKIASPDVEKNFKKFGINLPRELKKAKKEGRDLFETMQDLIEKATKGDATRLGFLFGDKEARSFADLLLNRLNRINDAQKRIRDAKTGILDRNNAAVLDTLDAKMQRLSTSWDNIVQKVGQGLGSAIEPALTAVSDSLDFRAAMEEGANKRGLTWAQQQKIVTFGNSHDRGLLAYDGGWRSSAQSDKGPMHLSPELPSHRQDEINDPDLPPLPPLTKGEKRSAQALPGKKDAIPTPQERPLPDLPVKYPAFPITPDMVQDIKHELRGLLSPVADSFIKSPHIMPGAGYREAEQASMAAFFRDYHKLPHDLADQIVHSNRVFEEDRATRLRAPDEPGVVRKPYQRTGSESMPQSEAFRVLSEQAARAAEAFRQIEVPPELVARLDGLSRASSSGLPGGGFREAEEASMAAYNRNRNVSGVDPDRLAQAMEQGGSTISQAGETAGSALEAAGQSLASLIPGAGDALAAKLMDAAARFRAELSNLTINIRPQGLPAPAGGGRNLGVSMPNAGRSSAPSGSTGGL